MNGIEIAVTSKAKQGFIFRHLIENHLTAKALADRIGISQITMYEIINFRWLPPQSNDSKLSISKKKSTVEKLEAYFRVPIEYLFPPELTLHLAKKLRGIRVSFHEIEFLKIENVDEKYLTYNPETEDQVAVDVFIQRALSTLRPHEEKCLRLRFGIGDNAPERLESATRPATPNRRRRTINQGVNI